jgi:organic hydroperoxide reductase OsmC/OhrA
MHPYPHHYIVSAAGCATGPVTISAPGLPSVETAPPPQFGGPSGVWSPETLLTAAVADCFILTFRAIARAVRFDWLALDCRVEGTLERIEGQSLFTGFTTTVRLTVPPAADMTKARRLLEQAEQGCLIANSLRAERALSVEVVTAVRAASTTEAVHAR